LKVFRALRVFRASVMAVVLASALISEAGAINRKGLLVEKLYLQESYRSAAYECERLFKEERDGAFKNEIAYLAGLTYLKLKNFPKARKFFGYVLNNSNDSLLLSEAQAGLDNASKHSPPENEPAYFSVQVGSFKSKKNAVRLYRRFKRRKYTVRVTEEKDGRVTIYKVKIGRFKTRSSCVSFARKLRKMGYQTVIADY